MRTFSHGPASRGIAHGLLVAFLWSAVLVAAAVAPAGAQVPTSGGIVTTRGGATQSVAVVPFENQSGYRPETFGQEAADAVSTELRDRLNLDPLPKADIELWLRDLGYTPPFSDVELVRLATEIEIAMMVTGQVRSARVVDGPEGRYGEVTLAILLFDRIAQAPTNGALVTSRGPVSRDASDDTLITKALQQASFDAVQNMRTRPTVTAMVLWARDATVFLNVGGRAGVEPGMKMVAMRGNLRIGMVEVTEASPIGSYATIIQGPPLRTGDHLRGIYQIPVGPAGVSPQRLERKKKGMYNMVLAAAAILGVAELGSTSRGLEEGAVAAPAFMASNLANGVALGFSAGPDFPAAVISWIPYSGTEKTRLAGYEIQRNNMLVDVLSARELAEKNYAIDLAFPVEYQVTIAIDDVTAAVPTFTFERTLSTSDPSITVGLSDITWVFISGMLMPGFTYYYQVKPVVAFQYRLADGTYEWRLSRESQLSSMANVVTAVAPTSETSVALAGSIATFVFYTAAGADEAVIQIARDPNNSFPPAQTFKKVVSGLLPGKHTVAVSLTSELASLPGTKSSILWWRVGLRSRNDTTQPRPLPFSLGNDYGYVWSGLPQTIPGAPVASVSAKRQRDMLRLGELGRQRQHSRTGPARDRMLRVD